MKYSKRTAFTLQDLLDSLGQYRGKVPSYEPYYEEYTLIRFVILVVVEHLPKICQIELLRPGFTDLETSLPSKPRVPTHRCCGPFGFLGLGSFVLLKTR